MIIYGEYLFLENFITGLVIIFFTGKIAGEKLKPWRIAISAVCCGLYAFVLFTGISGLLSILIKMAFAVFTAAVSFGRHSFRKTMMNGMLFLLVTFFYGGIAIALLTAFGWEGVTAAGGLYMPQVTYLTVMSAATAAALLIWLAASLIKEKRQEARHTVETVISMGEKNWTLSGYIDSGNFLKEPLTGRPVAVVGRSLMEKMLDGMDDSQIRYTVIPYRAVGTDRGIMDGYKADYMKIPGKTIRRPVLAVCEDDKFLTGECSRQILLPAEMFERGIYVGFD